MTCHCVVQRGRAANASERWWPESVDFGACAGGGGGGQQISMFSATAVERSDFSGLCRNLSIQSLIFKPVFFKLRQAGGGGCQLVQGGGGGDVACTALCLTQPTDVIFYGDRERETA